MFTIPSHGKTCHGFPEKKTSDMAAGPGEPIRNPWDYPPEPHGKIRWVFENGDFMIYPLVNGGFMVILWWFYYKTIGKWWFNHQENGDFMMV